MFFIEVSPYIRFANEVFVPKRKQEMYCTDCRLIYITDGSGKIILNGKNHDFSKGTLLLWQSNTLYKFSFKNRVRALVIDFDLVANGENSTEILPLIFKENIDSEKQNDTFYFSDTTALNSPVILHNALWAEEKIRHIADELKKQTPFSNCDASAHLKLCLSKILKTEMSKERTSEISKKIDFVTEYIRENLNSELSNNLLAELTGYHPYYLNRAFKEMKGFTLHQYILNYRLSAAADYLLSTSFTLTEIAEKVGFNNQISFINAFKKRYNLTPTEFRNKTL